MTVKMHEIRTIEFFDEPVRDHNAFGFENRRTVENRDEPFTNRTNSQTNRERTDVILKKSFVSIKQGNRAALSAIVDVLFAYDHIYSCDRFNNIFIVTNLSKW